MAGTGTIEAARADASAGRVHTLGGPAAWTAPALASSGEWLVRFDEAQRDELRAAARHLARDDRPPASIVRDDVPLPASAPLLDDARRRLERGAGMLVMRGAPVDDLALDEARAMTWALCLNLGTAIPQNASGDLMGDVRAGAGTATERMGRWYASNARLGFHTDRCDVLALVAVRVAAAGGLSQVASAVAIHDAMAASRPDLLELLHEPFCWRVPERGAPDAAPFHRQPVMSVFDGGLSCVYNRFQIEAGHRHPQSVRLTAAQREALDLFESLASDERHALSFMLEPGDVELLNNHVVLHARTAFDDAPGAHPRHLLRVWLSMRESRALDPAARSSFRDCRAGAVRGGYAVAPRLAFTGDP